MSCHLVDRVPDLRVREVELHLEVLEVPLRGVHQLERDVALAGGLDGEDVLGTRNKQTRHKKQNTVASVNTSIYGARGRKRKRDTQTKQKSYV